MKKYLPIILFILLLGLGWYFVQGKGNSIKISNSGNSVPSISGAPSESPKLEAKSPLSGLACANANRRPMAVMLAGDPVARPVAGLAEADIVFNMPVITDSMTRLMAVFVCNTPKEIGSVRSARHDYIELARGLDAIFVHWGGSHFALDKLDKGIMDNIDALKNPDDAFFRKSGIAAPHNGFTSSSRLLEASQKLGYRVEGKEDNYLFFDATPASSATTTKTLMIDFPGAFQVKYVYDPAKNSYLRWRGGAKETDRNNGQQVAAKNVVAMITVSRQIEGQYNDVDVSGSGRAQFYRNGEEIFGTWKKSATDQTSKLFFYDNAGEEIKFVPGQIWVEVVQTNQAVSWK